jgi:3-methyladenine DNA glycosylase/8-oxoguanine DNA glycosylase
MLGTDRDLTDFNRHARRMPWLALLVRRMRGIKPPRYPTLWEACVNTIVFQQISLQAASSIMRRLILLLGDSAEYEGVPLAIFPSVERFLGASDAAIRAAGLSPGKLSALAAPAMRCNDQFERSSSEFRGTSHAPTRRTHRAGAHRGDAGVAARHAVLLPAARAPGDA